MFWIMIRHAESEIRRVGFQVCL